VEYLFLFKVKVQNFTNIVKLIDYSAITTKNPQQVFAED
jgi:hypothetical protein